MLEHHFSEVQDSLLAKKAEKEDEIAEANDEIMSSGGGLKSPGLPIGPGGAAAAAGGGGGGTTPGRSSRAEAGFTSPKLPVLGYFSVTGHSSPRSPRSPLKKTF